MKKQLEQVKQFHNGGGHPVYEVPIFPPADRAVLRYKLMSEENEEFIAACREKDGVGIADAITDMFYVLCGTALECGLGNHMEALFDEVHRSNMSKFGPDGKPILREDGKQLKGPNYTPPDLAKILFSKQALLK